MEDLSDEECKYLAIQELERNEKQGHHYLFPAPQTFLEIKAQRMNCYCSLL